MKRNVPSYFCAVLVASRKIQRHCMSTPHNSSNKTHRKFKWKQTLNYTGAVLSSPLLALEATVAQQADSDSKNSFKDKCFLHDKAILLLSSKQNFIFHVHGFNKLRHSGFYL